MPMAARPALSILRLSARHILQGVGTGASPLFCFFVSAQRQPCLSKRSAALSRTRRCVGGGPKDQDGWTVPPDTHCISHLAFQNTGTCR